MSGASIGRDFLVWGVAQGVVQEKRQVSVRRQRCGHEVNQVWAWEGKEDWTFGLDRMAGYDGERLRHLAP